MLLSQHHQPNAHSYYKIRTSLQTSKMHINTAKAALLEETEQDSLRVKPTTTTQKNSLPQRGEKKPYQPKCTFLLQEEQNPRTSKLHIITAPKKKKTTPTTTTLFFRRCIHTENT